MITIRFAPNRVDPAWHDNWVPKRPPDCLPTSALELTRDDFIFECFRVDAEFVFGEIDFSAGVKFVPVLDFVFMLEFARRMLVDSGEAEVQLSDLKDTWFFRQYGQSVELSSGFREGVGRSSFSEYAHAVETSLHSAIGLICAHQPIARQNQYLNRLAREGFPPG